MSRLSKLKGEIIFCVAALVCAAGPVLAQNPHFIRVTASLESDGDLDVRFKEAGLGDTATSYVASASSTATCTCVTNSGRCPAAANKVTFSQQVSTAGTFSPHNGSVSAVLVISAPACPPSDPPTCGGGQTLKLSEISYTDIAITDTTHSVGPETATPSSLAATFFACP